MAIERCQRAAPKDRRQSSAGRRRIFVVEKGKLFVAIATLLAAPAVQSQERSAAVESKVEIKQFFDVRTSTRDGVELSSDVWLPAAAGRYPIILVRTPYVKASAESSEYGRYFAERGYAFVVQDVRGRGDSDGEFDFFFQEAKDGYDTIEALARQPWANGRVCMMGVSYMATVQWLAAKERPPHLTCIAPTSPGARFLNELPYVGGAFVTQWALGWLNGTSGHVRQQPNSSTVDWERVLNHRPLLTADEAMGRKMRLYREFLQNDTLNDYWKRIYLNPSDFSKIDIPVLAITGLYDADQPGAMFTWEGIERNSPGSRSDRYFIMGPWTHGQSYDGGETKIGEAEFSKNSIIDNKAVTLAFFERYLKQKSDTLDLPRVQIYVTGANAWRTFTDYPRHKDQVERLYLSSGGEANGEKSDGRLTWQQAPGAGSDHYVYDPRNPVRQFALEARGNMGWAEDRREIQRRADVLVYTSPSLKKAIEVIGKVEVELYASSDARDTDFTASLSDVYPDGRSVSLGHLPVGIIRARYRDGLHKTELLVPGKPYLFRIEVGHIAHAFLPGHKIRLEISSSAYPLFSPNQNTGNPVATDTEWRSARQTVFHDTDRPSAILLPIHKN